MMKITQLQLNSSNIISQIILSFLNLKLQSVQKKMEIQHMMLMNGGDNNRFYGWPAPASGRILCGGISSTSSSSASAEMKVMVNGNEAGNNYIITKPSFAYSSHFTFSTPLEINAGDRINFQSKTSNGSVTHSVVQQFNYCIELNI